MHPNGFSSGIGLHEGCHSSSSSSGWQLYPEAVESQVLETTHIQLLRIYTPQLFCGHMWYIAPTNRCHGSVHIASEKICIINVFHFDEAAGILHLAMIFAHADYKTQKTYLQENHADAGCLARLLTVLHWLKIPRWELKIWATEAYGRHDHYE